jgi:hypothetical protein
VHFSFRLRVYLKTARTVAAMAAGTLKMIDMIGFRFRSMNTVAIAFAMKATRKKIKLKVWS